MCLQKLLGLLGVLVRSILSPRRVVSFFAKLASPGVTDASWYLGLHR